MMGSHILTARCVTWIYFVSLLNICPSYGSNLQDGTPPLILPPAFVLLLFVLFIYRRLSSTM